MNRNENLSPIVIAKIISEIRSLCRKPPASGIRVSFNEENVTEVLAEIDGPEDTPYEGGIFQVKLVLGSDFPCTPPRGFFLTKIFHPNVTWKNGDICVNVLKRDWTSDLGIRHILTIIRCLLIVPNAESALNEDAGRLLLDDYEEYARRARLMTRIHAIQHSRGMRRSHKEMKHIDRCTTDVEPHTDDTNKVAITTPPSTISSSMQNIMNSKLKKTKRQAADKKSGKSRLRRL